MKTEKNYYSALDGIRGLGILLVLIAHFRLFYLIELTPHAPWEVAWLQIADFNWMAMEWFFAMSGFLITGILLRTKMQEGFFKNFYMRRFFRIFPLYYGFLFVYFKVLPHFMDLAHNPESAFSFVSENQGWYWTYMGNYLIALQGTWLGEMSHFWSLSVEEHFYIFWPFLIYWLGNRTILALSTALVAASIALRAYFVWHIGLAPVSVYVMTITRLDSLLLGSMLAVVAHMASPGIKNFSGLMKIRSWLTGLSVAFVPFIVWFYARENHFNVAGEDISAKLQSHLYPEIQVFGYTMVGVMSCALVVWLLTGSDRNLLKRFFSWRVFGTLGQYSYGMYVIHFAVFGIFHQSPLSVAALSKTLGSRALATPIAFMVPFLVTVAGAWAIWMGYERHFIKLKSFFEYDKRQAPAAPAVLAGAGAQS
jgi:peptidoglycan/LPS O-acetylase OafA/YrhL